MTCASPSRNYSTYSEIDMAFSYRVILLALFSTLAVLAAECAACYTLWCATSVYNKHTIVGSSLLLAAGSLSVFCLLKTVMTLACASGLPIYWMPAGACEAKLPLFGCSLVWFLPMSLLVIPCWVGTHSGWVLHLKVFALLSVVITLFIFYVSGVLTI